MTDAHTSSGRIAAGIRRRLPGGRVQRLRRDLELERERITRLEAELDELRRDSLRIAELVDLVESRLTP